MLALLKRGSFYGKRPVKVLQHNERQLLAFVRGEYLFAFNFSPVNSYTDLRVDLPPGNYKHIMDTDMKIFGGFGRVESGGVHFSMQEGDLNFIKIYLPSRCGIVFKKGK